jgi:hypothetical protein
MKESKAIPLREWKVGLPMFTCHRDWDHCTATLYSAHYHRLVAVVAAARTKNELLIKLALKNLDDKGSGPNED